MSTDSELAAVGKNIKRATLVQQAKVNASQARAEATELAKFGWHTAQSDELEAQTAALELLVSAQSAVREDARTSSENLAIVLDEGRTYVRKLRAALRPILRALPHADTTKSMFKAGVSLHNSVANLSAYLIKIRPGVEHLTPQLQAALPGPAPLDVLDQLRAKLDAASTKAAVARGKIPALTQSLNEAKGRILLTLRDLLQYARVAFDAEPERMGKFYLNLLGGRAATIATEVTVVAPAAPTTPTAPVAVTLPTTVAPAAPVSPPHPLGGTGGGT